MSESLGRLYRSLTLLPQLSRTEATTSAAAESNGHKSPEPGSDRADEDQLPPLSGYESVIIARGSEAERIFYPDDGSRTPNSDNDNGTGNGNGTVSRPQCKPGNGHPRRGKHARHSHAVTNPVPTASEILGLPGSWLSSQETEAQAKWDTTDGSGGIAVVVAEESAPARSERAPTERMDETVLKRSMVALDSFVGKYIRIWIAGPRLFIGVVAMFDRVCCCPLVPFLSSLFLFLSILRE